MSNALDPLAVTVVDVAPEDRTASRVSNGRWVVLAVALVCLGVKLYMAAATFGTNDVPHWMLFARVVNAVGPVKVYAYPFKGIVYNHPPLIGYFLVGINWLTHYGLPVKFSIRAASSIADAISALLVFEIVRARRPLPSAVASGIMVAASPVLFAVSGFHGNTDPIFAMLTLLSLWLLADRHMPVLAGFALVTACSVKIVPLVVAPLLLVYAWRVGQRFFWRFVAASGVLAAVIWLPAVLREWVFIHKDVLGYTGSPVRWWGIPQMATWAGHPSVGTLMAGGARTALFVVCAGLPAIVVWRRPEWVAECTGLAMCGFLLLSPAAATQYLAWPVAAAFLVGFWPASAYSLAAGALLIHIYTRWSGTFWWDVAHATVPTPAERRFGVVVWLALLSVVVEGVLLMVVRPLRHGRLRYSLHP